MQSKVDLNSVSPDELAKALRERLVAEGKTRFWPKEVYELYRLISLFPCVDAFPVRWRGLKIPEIGFILRNTGTYKGRWWDIGGRVTRGESLSQAMKRHVTETLGVDFSLIQGQTWNRPFWVSEHYPEGTDSLSLEEGEFAGFQEPNNYSLAPTYLIELASEDFKFGSTAHGGQEAGDFRWFPLDNLPFDNLAYGGEHTVRACAEWVRTNLP